MHDRRSVIYSISFLGKGGPDPRRWNEHGDGGPYHDNMVKAAMNADLLVTEAGYKETIYSSMDGDVYWELRIENYELGIRNGGVIRLWRGPTFLILN